MPERPASTAALEVLIVDDEETSREALELCAEALGHASTCVASANEAARASAAEGYDVALVDLRLGADSGLDLVTALVEGSPWLQVVVITAHGSIESAVEAMRRGAVDYVEKPVSPAKLDVILRRVSRVRELEHGLERLRDDLERSAPRPTLRTASPSMRRVHALARKAAASKATILIRGESGTGKGVLARAIHEWSPRSARPFSVVSTPTLSRELLESELFGHVKGAFTGAVRNRPGRISGTEGGTLFLDEIGAMPVELQPKLLRFLQDQTYEAVGGDTTHVADVRMILATNLDLERAVEAGDFREDLYFRVRVIEIVVPPLRERRDDIVPLAERFVEFFGARNGRPGVRLTDEAKRRLAEREWPGNVRELLNAVERAVILSSSTRIGAAQLIPTDGGPSASGGDGAALITLEEAERRHIEGVLSATSSAKEAARVLGVSPTTLWRRRRKHDL